MAKPKFDYNGKEFYDEIERLALQGQCDAEIAYSLADKFGVDLSPGVFSDMKNGKYPGWTKEENEKRCKVISLKLERGRYKMNSMVRGRFLKTAMGLIKVKGVTVTKRHMIVDGQQTPDMIVETRETEQETPPSMQGLSTWLYHFDPQWREVQDLKKKSDSELPFDPKKGISIEKWIEKEIESDSENDPTEDIKDADEA